MRHVDDRWCFAFVQSQFQPLFPITSHRHKASRRILPSAFAWFESICTLDFTVWVFQDRKEQLSGVGICYVGMLATFVILCLSLTSKISKVVSVALDSRNIKKPWFRRARHQSRKFRRVSSSANVVFHNKKIQENEESAKPQHLGHLLDNLCSILFARSLAQNTVCTADVWQRQHHDIKQIEKQELS